MLFYSIYFRQYKLNRYQQVNVIVHVYDGLTYCFFLENCFDCGSMSYPKMISVICCEYSSNSRSIQVKGTLETVRIRPFMA